MKNLQIFKIKDDTINSKDYKREYEEKDIKEFVSKNINIILNNENIIDYKNEFKIGEEAKRIDTIAIDKKGNIFIIEYKKNENAQLITQIVDYYTIISNNYDILYSLLNSKDDSKFNLDLIKKAVKKKNIQLIGFANKFNKKDESTAKALVKSKDFEINLIEYSFLKETLAISPLILGDFKVEKNNEKQKQNNSIFDNSYKKRVLEYKDNSSIMEIIDYCTTENNDLILNETVQYISLRKNNETIISIIPWKNTIDIFFTGKFDDLIKKYDFIENYEKKGHWGIGNIKFKISRFDENHKKLLNFILKN